MQIKTILNRVQKYKSFVYGAVHWAEEATVPTLDVEMQARTNSRPVCSHCGCKRPGYDRLLNEVRAQEAKDLKEKGYEPVLTKTRGLLLKRPENLTEKQDTKLAELLQYNLKSIRSYLLKEEFQLFWQYTSPYWAGEFLDKWCTKTMWSKIEPMKRVAKMLRRHRPLLMNWFRAKKPFSSGIVEGFNTKAKLTTRKAYGFRTYHAAEIALYQKPA